MGNNSFLTNSPSFLPQLLLWFVPCVLVVLVPNACLDAALLVTSIWVIKSIALGLVLQAHMHALLLGMLLLWPVVPDSCFQHVATARHLYGHTTRPVI